MPAPCAEAVGVAYGTFRIIDMSGDFPQGRSKKVSWAGEAREFPDYSPP
jgi:hypothetical protein